MEEIHISVESETWERTTALRILRPLSGFVGTHDRLQQGWFCHETGKIEWRDVQIETMPLGTTPHV